MIGLKLRNEHQPGECLGGLNAINRLKVPEDVRMCCKEIANDHRASGGVSLVRRTVLGITISLRQTAFRRFLFREASDRVSGV